MTRVIHHHQSAVKGYFQKYDSVCNTAPAVSSADLCIFAKKYFNSARGFIKYTYTS